jgi:hypothetical protein
MEYINNFYLTSSVTWRDLQEMPNVDYEAFKLCTEAQNVANEIKAAMRPKPGQIASAYNRQHFAQRLGIE